jgi:outer membrane immunogenic protein
VSYFAIDIPDIETPPIPPLPNLSYNSVPQTGGQNGAFAYGVATGLGMDVALTSNLFVRGEFEYIFFPPVNSIQGSLWSARVGAGVKF